MKRPPIFLILIGIISLAVLLFALHNPKKDTRSRAVNVTQTPKTLRVIEVRYFPKGETDVVYQPDLLSSQLQSYLSNASKFHGYSNITTASSINVQVVKVYNRDTARPNPDGTWESTYKAILAQDNLCQQIQDLNIDQIWLWVDPRPTYDPNPGVEYAISSPFFQNGVQYATYASPTLCAGSRSFVVMGFDDTRTADYALHSFGHLLEGLIGNLETVELFWYRYAGNTAQGFPLTQRCGNVHYPPNGVIDYDYANQTVVSSFCENWDPYGANAPKSFNCTEWSCTQLGYLTWWMQNMPNYGNNIMYQGLQLPNWWDFLVNMDTSIAYYRDNPSYFIDRNFISLNTVSPSPSAPLLTPSPSVTPTPSPTASPTSVPVVASLFIKFKLQNVNVANFSGTFNLEVMKNGNTVYSVNFLENSSAGGVYYLSIPYNFTPDIYDIYIKENSHLQKKFANITLLAGTNTEDFTSLPLLAGDLNNDNKFDISDIGLILSQYTQLEVPVTALNKIYDINGDGTIDVTDIGILLSNYTQLEVYGD